MNTASVILLTLIVYSAVTTAVYLISEQFLSPEISDNVECFLAVGIAGVALWVVLAAVRGIKSLFGRHIGRRSIFEDRETGQRYKCRTGRADDFEALHGFRPVKRYAAKKEWRDVPDFPQDVEEASRKICRYCRHDDECDCEVRCSRDEYGFLKHDRFERAGKRR